MNAKLSMPIVSRLMRRLDVARYVSLSAKTIQRWVQAGKFPQPVIASPPMWDRLDVDGWIENQKCRQVDCVSTSPRVD